MFPGFLSPEVINLSESTSIALAKQIQAEPINTPLTPQSILTTYVKQGVGNTPILLIHGFDSSVFEFRRLLPLLAQERETWVVDLLGFGFTERKAGLSFNTENIKTHLYCFWQTLINQPVILVGASMGGAVALDFTLSHPQVVKQLVLLDSAGLAKPPLIGKFMFPPLGYLATEFLRNPRVRSSISAAAYYDKSFNSPDAQLCASLHLDSPGWSQALISFTKSGGYHSFLDKLSAIKQSTLILWGKKDQILGTKDADKFQQLITNSKLVWIENCGHVPHLEKPQTTAQEVLVFSNQL